MKKPNKIHHQKLSIKQENVAKLQALQQSADGDSPFALLLACLHEDDSLKQAALLKKISIAINEAVTRDDTAFETCLEVLAHVFVIVDYKNPARRTLASLFDNLPESVHNDALTCLSSTVLEKIEEKKIQTTATGCDLRPAIDLVSSLMENFKLGNKVIGTNGLQVLRCLAMYLQHFVQNTRTTTNPADQTIIMNNCLAATKIIIAVIQKSCPRQTIASTNTTLPSTWVCQLKAVATELITILNNDFLPDCQTASGMALCLIISMTSKQRSKVILETVFPHCKIIQALAQQQVEQGWVLTVMEQRKWQVPISFAHLCLCHGVLTMVPLEVLLRPLDCSKSLQDKSAIKSQSPKTLLFDVLFHDLCLLCKSLKEPFSCLTAFKVLTLWAEQARNAIMLDNAPPSLSAQGVGSAVIPQKLLSFVWDHWDHPIEIVRYQTKAIFEHVVSMHVAASGQEPSSDNFLKNLTGKLLEVGWHRRGIYGPLCCLASIMGAKCLLGWHPCIPAQVMGVLKDPITAPHVIDFVNVISRTHKQEILVAGEDMSVWLKTWIVPIINLIHHQGSVQNSVLIEQTLSKLLKCHPKSLQFIVSNLQNQHDKNIEILITCLKTARTLGLVKVNDDDDSGLQEEENWGGVVPVDWLKKALCHIEEQTRLDALGLLCDTPRTTEPISVTDLALLKVFLPLNLNNQSPSFRQQCSTHLKKLLLRMKESLRISAKKLGRSKDAEIHTHRLKSCQEFLVWFSELLFASLFPGASFARRTSALHFLKLLSSIFVDDRKGTKREPFLFHDVMTTTNVTVLVECLSDSYDVNKVLAYELLATCPANILPFQTPYTLQLWYHRIDSLLSSPKAVDASTASVTLKLLVEKCSLSLYQTPKTPHKRNTLCREEPGAESQVFRVLCYLLETLKTQSAVAELSLNQAASQAPMHGLVYCLRAMLCHLPLRQFSSDSSWQQLVSSLLDECIHVAILVSPVVTSSSPEGHVIECDYGHVIDDCEDDLDPEGDDSQVFNASSQVLLTCCWRTMKEVALLLGDTVQNAPIGKDTTGLLTSEQVRRVGDFFTTVLLTSKHHGAFELAYNGFVKLCSTLWTCDDATLRQLPQQWLDSLISDIAECVPTDVLCGTRRSAGVPFYVQAIVTTEPVASGKSCFKRLMAELISVASLPIDKEIPKDSTLPQVHARNVLRALFRDTHLGEDVFPFVARGLKVAISGFLSDSWAVRNSSTLLFSALMTRIFGVKKSKDEHSRRNCMTGREFFTRFPELHFFLLDQLRQSTEAIDKYSDLDLHPSLYPVLVLLSRLYPSTLDGADSTLNMAAFVPYVIRCGSSSVLKTRAMAARAVVPLVTGESMVQTLQELVKSLPTSSSNVKQNKMHGALLQIQHLVKEHLVQSTPSDLVKSLVTSKVLPLLEPVHWIASRSNPCDVTRAVYLDIALNLLIYPYLEVKEQNREHDNLAPDNEVFDMRRVITQNALDEITTDDGPRPLVPIGQTLVKEACARILLTTAKQHGKPGTEDDTKTSEQRSSVRICPNSTSGSSSKSAEHDGYSKMPNDSSSLPMNLCHVIRCLLASRDYEIRLITLQYLNTNLSRYHPTSRKPFLVHSNVMKEGNDSLEDGKDKKLFSVEDGEDNTLFSVEDVKQIAAAVLGMAVEREQHLDCLGQVYQVLSVVMDSLSFPQSIPSGETISLLECWQHVLMQACKSSEQRDGIKCALLDFLASMADRVYHKLSTADNDISAVQFTTKSSIQDSLGVFSSLLKSCCHEDKSFDVRLKTAEILSSGSLSALLWDPSRLLGDYPLDLWEVVVNLLHDDDSSVRDCASRITMIQTSGNTETDLCSLAVPTLADASVLRGVFNHFCPREPRSTLQWMLGWITACDTIRDAEKQNKACSNDQSSEIDLLFDKNSLNSYREKLIDAQGVVQCLKDVTASATQPLRRHCDVIDDFSMTFVHRLQQVLQENGHDFSNLFVEVCCNVLGLVATGLLRNATIDDQRAMQSEHDPDSLTLSNCVISNGQEVRFTESVVTCVEEFYSKSSTNVRFKDLIRHPLMRKYLIDLCEIYGIAQRY